MPEASLELLQSFVEEAIDAPLLLVITYRDQPQFLEAWQAASGAEEIELEPLGRRATVFLARKVAQTPPHQRHPGYRL